MSFAQVLRGEPGRREWIFSYLQRQRQRRDGRWLLEENRRNRFGGLNDCGGRTAGSCSDERASGCVGVSASADTEVLAAKERFLHLLKALPAPPGF